MSYGSGNSGNYKKLRGQNIQVLDTDPLAYEVMFLQTIKILQKLGMVQLGLKLMN